MFDALRKLFLAMNVQANVSALGRDLRRMVVLALRAKGSLREHLAGMQQIADFIASETATWITPEDIAAGRGGHFDTCDVRHWLAIARRAGVPAVPARTVLELSEAEMGVAAGEVRLPESYRTRLAKAIETHLPHIEVPLEVPAPPDSEEVAEKLAAAMDDVPEGWMVRHVRSGPSTLKTLAGVGVAGPAAPEVRFGSDVEIGPGWIRHGNRRAVDAADHRILEHYARGPDGPSVFVARPWVQAARFMVAEDPHRHGSQYAGKGFWPAEWRAYVTDGRVTGVGFYYAWAGEMSPESAAAAIAVRDLAQRVVDEAVRLRAFPLYLDTEIVRRDGPLREKLEANFPRDSVACTLDFIETKSGPLLLEGGPPFNPFVGGGHPTAFAGFPGPFEGVAFRCLPGVNLADPKTWRGKRDPAGCVLSWSEVEALAVAEPALDALVF
jgi:hypothetical protein